MEWKLRDRITLSSIISSGAHWNCDSSKEINTGTRYVSLSFIIPVNFEFRDRLKSPIHFLIILRYEWYRYDPPELGPPVLLWNLTKNSAKRRTYAAIKKKKPHGSSGPLVHLDRTPMFLSPVLRQYCLVGFVIGSVAIPRPRLGWKDGGHSKYKEMYGNL